ncbi:MAG: PorT family protein [Ferruginibacter sp.]|nr:PorT family protein [Ferruginibacter sp.]
MKKGIFLFIILFSVYSMNTNAQILKVGIKAGTDIKKLSGKSFDDQFSYGYHVGAFAEIKLSEKFGLQPEVYFSQVNIDTSSNFSSVYNFKDLSKVQLKYINIPLLLSFKPNKFVALQAGPQYGILIDKSNTVLQNGQDAFKKGDFSMLAGIQLHFSKVRLYGRYIVGLTDINDIDNQENWKAQTIQIGLGIAF